MFMRHGFFYVAERCINKEDYKLEELLNFQFTF